VSTLIERLLNIPSPLALALITLLVFGEAAVFVGFVLPGETAVLLGGVLASTGHLPLLVLLPAVVIAAVLGDSAGYEIGRRFGTRLLALRPLGRHHARITTARTSLRERGGWAVLIGRFTAFLRAAMPALAGISQMPYPRFLAYNAAGALVWGPGVALLGYCVGMSYAHAERFLGPSSALLVLVFVLIGASIWRRRRNKQPKQGNGNRLHSAHTRSTSHKR
jgi:membrane-associated protein